MCENYAFLHEVGPGRPCCPRTHRPGRLLGLLVSRWTLASGPWGRRRSPGGRNTNCGSQEIKGWPIHKYKSTHLPLYGGVLHNAANVVGRLKAGLT